MFQSSQFIAVEVEKDVEYWLSVYFFRSDRSNKSVEFHMCSFCFVKFAMHCFVCDSYMRGNVVTQNLHILMLAWSWVNNLKTNFNKGEGG